MLKVNSRSMARGFARCFAGLGCLEAAERRNHLEDRLKELMQELGNAINESLSDSDRIAAAIGEIDVYKRQGRILSCPIAGDSS